MSDFKRARSADAKRSREAAILDAAKLLAIRDGVLSATLTGIAKETGMHKSAMLRYFETRELIFLRLASQQWAEWGPAVSHAIEEATNADDVGSAIAATLTERPLFCDLLGHVPLSLERNVSVDSVRAFKSVTHVEVDRISSSLIGVFPELVEQDGIDVISTAISTAGSMWQMSTPGDVLAEVYRNEPGLAHAIVDLQPTLARIISALITGLRTARRASPDA
nr:TetR/AcrR family transcriptional regulator [Rhodococcus sp. (in: high G+C Gram-positive bacteria)]